MKTNILEIENLSVDFKGRDGKVFHALKNISLSVAEKERVSIVGESGSGKSTLLRAALMLIPHITGNIRLFGRDTNKISKAELSALRRKCGYVPQDPYGAIPPRLSALGAVTEPAVISETAMSKTEIRKRAESLLSEFGLIGDRILYSRAVSLSGGQRQRVEIARALMLAPHLMLCDEPTSMQDASTRMEITDALKRRTEMSLIFVTHDLLLAAHAAERIIVLKNGQICESGPAKQIMTAPQHDYTKSLIAALPKIDI
ncbi:MAG: ABC transporter ATP-binding protein [Synergistes sp.]|nr:ABC transporter ATP-binding protein [Synergistes sp.]